MDTQNIKLLSESRKVPKEQYGITWILTKLAVTGKPGSGKTTLVINIADILLQNGFGVGGIYTKEKTEGGKRMGFDIVDISTKRYDVLASVYSNSSVRVGKYGVEVGAIDKVCEDILEKVQYCDVVVIDEVGPMELNSSRFQEVIQKLLNGQKTCLFTVHFKSTNRIVGDVKNRSQLYYLSEDNRVEIASIISKNLLEIL